MSKIKESKQFKVGKWKTHLVPMSENFKCGSDGEIYEVYLAPDVVSAGAAGTETIIANKDTSGAVAWVSYDPDKDFGLIVWMPTVGVATMDNNLAPNKWRWALSIAPEGFIVGGEENFICIDQDFYIRFRRRFDLERAL